MTHRDVGLGRPAAAQALSLIFAISIAGKLGFGWLYDRLSVRGVMLCYFPPNQPTVGRCFDLGRGIGRAIQSWGDDRRVAIVASGGLSHFVIDEDLDRQVLLGMQAGDREVLAALPENRFRSGTSETKNWITAVGALSDTALQMTTVDYVPCYRSEAGTGNAMAFAFWR
jgi:3-O-methylgallate 3,4-dioxygenase